MEDKDIIVYCRIGQRSAHSWFEVADGALQGSAGPPSSGRQYSIRSASVMQPHSSPQDGQGRLAARTSHARSTTFHRSKASNAHSSAESVWTRTENDGEIVTPGTTQAFGNAHGLGLADQRHLKRRWRGRVVGHVGQRRWSITHERHRLFLALGPDCYPSWL